MINNEKCNNNYSYCFAPYYTIFVPNHHLPRSTIKLVRPARYVVYHAFTSPGRNTAYVHYISIATPNLSIPCVFVQGATSALPSIHNSPVTHPIGDDHLHILVLYIYKVYTAHVCTHSHIYVCVCVKKLSSLGCAAADVHPICISRPVQLPRKCVLANAHSRTNILDTKSAHTYKPHKSIGRT